MKARPNPRKAAAPRAKAKLSQAKVTGPKAKALRAKPESATSALPPGYRELRKSVLLRFEIDFVWKLLKASHGNISLAARTARIDRKHFWRLIKRTGIKVERV